MGQTLHLSCVWLWLRASMAVGVTSTPQPLLCLYPGGIHFYFLVYKTLC